jgi:hypothetical protein
VSGLGILEVLKGRKSLERSQINFRETEASCLAMVRCFVLEEHVNLKKGMKLERVSIGLWGKTLRISWKR